MRIFSPTLDQSPGAAPNGPSSRFFRGNGRQRLGLLSLAGTMLLTANAGEGTAGQLQEARDFESAATSSSEPWDHWETTVETGALFKIAGDTASSYNLFPIFLSIRTPQHGFERQLGGGTLLMRAQLRVFHQFITEAPESRYTGFSFSPSIEYWWNERWSWINSIGGGMGLIDSQPDYGALGQDLTLNWFIQTGLRYQLDENWSLQGNLIYQHMSNGGMTDPNPGLDALGFTVGLGYAW